jgi:aldehyde:ferredoxin oxidoreductase
MKSISGPSNRILEVDLSTSEVREFEISMEDRWMYLGGKGLGLKILYDQLEPGIDPLGEKNILAFMMGVFLGTGAPSSSRFSAITKSPLTGIMVTSSCGGPFGLTFKSTGYAGLFITGKSKKPVWLAIDDKGVNFNDASYLWGKDTHKTQQILNDGKKGAYMVIGPAGENRVKFANVSSGARFFGRGGIGAVMGAKNLKAVAAFGQRVKSIPVFPADFKKSLRKAGKYIEKNYVTTKQYRAFGTNALIKYSAEGGILPIHNFKLGTHEKAHQVSGETTKREHKTKKSSCTPCQIQCGYSGSYLIGEKQVPEYESNCHLGPNLGIFDREAISKWNDICNHMGMDTISTGVTLAYVMEAGEKGLIKTDLRFGSPSRIESMILDIANRIGQGDELANGCRWLSEKYGGTEFATHVKGLEMGAFDPRGVFGQGLSYAVANRGACHISAFLIGLETIVKYLKPMTIRAKPEFVIFMENLFAGINSLHTCIFTAYAFAQEPPLVKYTPLPLLRFVMQNAPRLAIRLMRVNLYNQLFSSITGIKLSQKDFLKAGERIHTLERYMNTREGISRKDDTLPEMFLKEGRACDPKKRTVPLDKMLDKYYRLRGFDRDGIPKLAKLGELGIL